jgi:tetratricopeptide (TPR) repeat protein
MKIFLSAVSSQFRDCREALTKDLSAVGHMVVVQEHFRQHGRTLLEKLEMLVAGCEAVVVLVGNAYGFEPDEPARPAGRPRWSYSQWEYFFAQGERLDGSTAPAKKIYVYFATPEYLKGHPTQETPELTNLQETYIAAIRASGQEFEPFSTPDMLCRRVLRDVPAPAAKASKPNNLPDRPLGSLFKGRDAFLADLRRRFSGPGNEARVIVASQAVHGLGGIGKTRAAVEYAWRFGDEYSALLFVRASSPSELRARLADLVGVLAIDTAETAVEPRLAAVFAWLDARPGWLLILDNVDAEDAAHEAQALLARLTAGDVLITSRIANWPAGVEPRELHVLGESDAVAFLLERTRNNRRKQPDDATAAESIARQLDGLALALEQAGTLIAKQRLSLAEYLARWQETRADVLKWYDKRLMKYPASVAVTWETSFAQLGPGEQALLRVLAFLDPAPIPLFFFDAAPLAAAVADPREALAGLAGLSLVRYAPEEDTVSVHRLVQEVTRGRASEPDRTAALRAALAAVNVVVPADADDVRTWGIWTPLAPHAAAVARQADDATIRAPTARLMDRLGTYFQYRGQLRAAEPFFHRALAIDERSIGPEHPNVAIRLNNLALLLHDTNRLGEAEPLFRRALAMGERSYGPEHPEVAPYLSNLAVLLKDTNRPGEAEPLYRRALAIAERSYGPEHPEIASYLSNLAVLLRDTNRSGEAEPLIRRALAIDEQSDGPEHPHVAIDLNNQALLLRATNRRVEAEPL